MSNDNVITEEIRATLARDDRIPHPAEVAVSEWHGNPARQRWKLPSAASGGEDRPLRAGRAEVKHQMRDDAAFDAVCRLAGVGGITNEIKVITAGIAG